MAILVREKSTGQWSAVLKDEDGTVVPNSNIQTATIKLINLDDGADTVINSRNGQDILGGSGGTGTNGFTFDASGNITWTMTPSDNAILDNNQNYERHQAVIAIGYDSTKSLKFVIEILVQNLRTVS